MRELRRASKNVHETVLKLVKKINPKHVLELGSGKGNLAKFIYDAGLDITASDIDIDQFKIKGIKCLQINLNKKIILTKKYDTIICSEVIEHLQNPKKLFIEAYLLLEKKGVLIITTPNNQNWFSRIYFLITGKLPMMESHPDHISPIFTWQLNKLLGNLFEIEQICFNRSVLPLIHFNIPIKNLQFGQNIILVLRKKN